MKVISNKAFTLIELLAVIIILAVVALIATPIVLDVIEDSKLSVGKSEANIVYNGIVNYCLNEEMEAQLNNNYKKICTSELDKDDVSNMVNLGSAEILEIEYTTKLTWLKIKSNGNIYSLKDNKMVEGDLTKPELPIESKSFAEDSWETISAIVKSGKAKDHYNVGDEKEVTLTGAYAGNYTVRISNMSTPEECGTKGFSQTACGFVVEFVDIITMYNMNSTSTNVGGWPASDMSSFVNNNIYNALSIDLKSAIIDTSSVSGHGNDDSANFLSKDKLYLFSTKEVWGKEGKNNNVNYDSAEAETRQLDYYKNKGVTTDNYSGAIKKYQDSASNWWLRSSDSRYTNVFYNVTSNGIFDGPWISENASRTYGVAPAFRIG